MSATINIVYLNEISDGSFRNMTVIFLWVFWGLGEMAILPIAKLTTSWKSFFLITVTIPSVLLNSVYFLIIETPKYMYTKDT